MDWLSYAEAVLQHINAYLPKILSLIKEILTTLFFFAVMIYGLWDIVRRVWRAHAK